jgi:NACalpha-BTF3-like transcription factor
MIIEIELKTNKMKINKANKVTTKLGVYHRALETVTNIFFVNYDNIAVNTSVKMYDRKMKLVSDNQTAYDKLADAVDKVEYSWMSDKMKK